MIALFRTLLFYAAFLLGTVPMVLLAVLAAPFSLPLMRRLTGLWGSWFFLCARLFLGIRLRLRGVVPQRGVLVASKHQSWYEAILTLHLFRDPAVVMKAELRDIPFWGYLAERHGSIFVERSHGSSALRSMLRAARPAAAAGRPVFIFPEGTRVAPGAAPPLKAGLYALYARLGLPLVPVALDSGRCWSRRFIKQAGVVTISFQPDIQPGLPRAEVEPLLHRAINADPESCPVRA